MSPLRLTVPDLGRTRSDLGGRPEHPPEGHLCRFCLQSPSPVHSRSSIFTPSSVVSFLLLLPLSLTRSHPSGSLNRFHGGPDTPFTPRPPLLSPAFRCPGRPPPFLPTRSHPDPDRPHEDLGRPRLRQINQRVIGFLHGPSLPRRRRTDGRVSPRAGPDPQRVVPTKSGLTTASDPISD